MSFLLHIVDRTSGMRWRPLIPAMCLMLAATAVHAQQRQQNQSMEERLRAQLRTTTTQLQEAQNELAVLKAGKSPAAPAAAGAAAAGEDAGSLKKELAAAKAQLAAERRSQEKNGESRQQAQAALEKANAQSAQYRHAYDELLKLARASEAERQQLSNGSKTQQLAVTQCEAKNAQLYAVGQEILQAYETMDITTIMGARQPFAAQSRVKYEQIAQQYGDKLYEGRFDMRSVSLPVPANSSANSGAANVGTAAPQ